MYRLSRFFVSDIAPGQNILRNGSFRIGKKGGEAAHGVLFAANGTCKTTLLSFLLTVFCPERRRFVQHLQSGGDKTLDQYLIPGRPAIVILDLVRILEADLFEEAPEEHLVIGQLLYRHKSSADKLDRTFFVASDPVRLFHELPEQWDHLLEQDRPFTAVREFLNTRVKRTSSQKEWEDVLEASGLDPWLMRHQVDFARTEGGVKDAFKFKSEAEFLAFFLGCVSDLDAAVKLRDNTEQSIRKVQDRPEKNARLKAIQMLKELMETFDVTADKWRGAGRGVNASRFQLGEAVHLLKEAGKEARGREEEAAGFVEAAKSGHAAVTAGMEVAEASVVKVTETRLSREIQELREKLASTTKAIGEKEAERDALKASEMIAEIRKQDAEIQTRDQALSKAGKELAPMEEMVDLRCAQYHARHEAEQKVLKEALVINDAACKEKNALLTDARDRLKKFRDELADLDKEITRLATRMESAVEARKELKLEPGETPTEGEKRLGANIEKSEKELRAFEADRSRIEEKLHAAHSEWKLLQQSAAGKESELTQAKKAVSEETDERKGLIADRNLQTIAGSKTFDPTSAGIASKLEDQIIRSTEKRDEVQSELSDLKSELRKLEGIDTLSVDSQTKRLIDHYLSHGISAGEVRPFPEYLSSRYEDPDRIADYLERDPGRFTGIMAAGKEVIERIKELPVPAFLHKPVVVSTPCDLNEVPFLDHHIVAPGDPKVYSRTYIDQEKVAMRKKADRMVQNLEERWGKIKSLEASARHLSAYRVRFPNKAAVDALTATVSTLTGEKDRIVEKIAEFEGVQAEQVEKKNALGAEIKNFGKRLSEKQQDLAQIGSWLRQYGKWEEWQGEKAVKEERRVERSGMTESAENTVLVVQGEIGEIKEERVRIKGQQKALMEKADEVPAGSKTSLKKAERAQALEMPLSELRKQHEEARACMLKTATELGIEALTGEREKLKKERQETRTRLTAYGQGVSYDAKTAEEWASKTLAERNEQATSIASRINELTEKRGEYTGTKGGKEAELKKNTALLKEKKRNNILPDVPGDLLETEDLTALDLRYRNEVEKHRDECRRLEDRLTQTTGMLENIKEWSNRIALCEASVKGYEPVWDNQSPRLDWPALIGTETPMDNAVSFQKTVDLTIGTAAKAARKEKAARKVMNAEFDSLQRKLRDESLAKLLPAVVDELRRHDMESLGLQSNEFIEKCNDIATNIESDLSRSSQFIESLVSMLLQQTKEYHQKLQAAAREVVPEDVYIYGKMPIIRSGTRLDFTKNDEAFRRSIDHWLDELIQQDRIPEVNPVAGNVLGAELLVRLLRAATGKKEFGIRLLKCDDTGQSYEPVGKDLGSGGEALTTAVLLYSLLTSMRKKRHQKDERIPAFLILDNPLGVCNRSDFLDAQLKVAWAMGIQCVYLTGINDRESIGLFEHRVAIRKGEKQLSIDGKPYNLLEIIEQNLEKAS